VDSAVTQVAGQVSIVLAGVAVLVFFCYAHNANNQTSVTRLGEISPFGRYFLALGAFFLKISPK
jgi:hypothetical protein